MDFNEYCHSESGYYPEYVTQKEMCVILGACKSTAYALQKKNQIPFIYTSTNEGRRQQIKTADILRYKYEQLCFNEPDGELAIMLRSYFEKRLKAYPQLLFVSDIRRFTGYAKTTVNNWIAHDVLKAFCYKNQRIKSPQRGKGTMITQKAFIDFLISPYYRNITRKSNLHKEQAQDCEKLFITLLAKRGVMNG